MDQLDCGVFDAFLRRRLAGVEHRHNFADSGAEEAWLGAPELRIICQMKTANHGQDEVVRVDYLDLAVNVARVNQSGAVSAVLVEHLGLAGVHQDPRIRRVHRLCHHQIYQHEQEGKSDGSGDQRPLPAQDIGNAVEAEDGPAKFDSEPVPGMELLSRLIHR